MRLADLSSYNTAAQRGPKLGLAAAIAATAGVVAVLAVRSGDAAAAMSSSSAACLAVVEPDEALVITAFGNPVRVVTQPGLAWRWPAPFEAAVPVDVRLRTTSTGLHDVGTRDGLRILVQAYVEWRVPQDPGRVTQYLRAVRNAPDEAAEQLRSYVGSSLEITAAASICPNSSTPTRRRCAARRLRGRAQGAAGAQVLALAVMANAGRLLKFQES